MHKLYIKENINSQIFLENILAQNNIKNYTIYKNQYGKPGLDNSQLFFNISHDKKTTVIALSDSPVGVDIEYLTYRQAVVNKYFTLEEQLRVLNTTDKNKTFTEIWTAKEAYVKMLGIGIEYGLQKVDTNSIKNKITYFYEEDYVIAICEKEGKHEYTVLR